MTKTWHVEEAGVRFSELLEMSLAEGPQVVTRRGVEVAVLVPIDQWRRLRRWPDRTSRNCCLRRKRARRRSRRRVRSIVIGCHRRKFFFIREVGGNHDRPEQSRELVRNSSE